MKTEFGIRIIDNSKATRYKMELKEDENAFSDIKSYLCKEKKELQDAINIFKDIAFQFSKSNDKNSEFGMKNCLNSMKEINSLLKNAQLTNNHCDRTKLYQKKAQHYKVMYCTAVLSYQERSLKDLLEILENEKKTWKSLKDRILSCKSRSGDYQKAFNSLKKRIKQQEDDNSKSILLDRIKRGENVEILYKREKELKEQITQAEKNRKKLKSELKSLSKYKEKRELEKELCEDNSRLKELIKEIC